MEFGVDRQWDVMALLPGWINFRLVNIFSPLITDFISEYPCSVTSMQKLYVRMASGHITFTLMYSILYQLFWSEKAGFKMSLQYCCRRRQPELYDIVPPLSILCLLFDDDNCSYFIH